MTNRIIANRTDGTTERLMAVFNGLYIAEKCGLNFSFRWLMSDAQTTGAQRVPYVDELFSAEFIEKYHDTTSDFSAIPKLPNTRKAKNIQALLDIVKNGSWLSSKDHLAEKYSNSTQLRYDFTNNFTESIFSTKVVEAVKKARSIDSDVQNWVSIHLRAGDVIYGRYRHHGIFAHMCIPLPVAKFLIGNLEKNGQKAVLFGQDHNTISYLNDSDLPCFSAAEYYQKLNIDDDLSRLIFDVVLMSKTSRIIAGGSGVPRFASCIGANQLIHYQDIVTADQQYELTDSDVQENAVHYTGVQSAFAYWAAYFRASDVTPHEQADHYLKMASIYDPENYCYRIKRLGLNFRALQDETAEEILRVDGCADDEDAARRLTRALLTRNLAIYGFLFDQELRVIAAAATRKNRGAKALMRQILQFAANPRYKFADDLHKLLPDTLTLAAVQETPEPHRFTFYVNEWVGEVEVEVPGDVAIIPISAASHDDGTFRMAKMKGDNNILYLGEGADIKKVVFDVVGNGNKMIVGRNAQLKGMISFRGNNNVIFIGAGTTFNSATLIAKYSANIYIGRDCMFSSGIEVRTSDSHSIVDLETMMKSNDSQGVFIGDHVWVSKNVVVQKGAAIAADNVIGISSFVRGHFPDSSTIIVGSPARVAKTGKSWARNELFDAEKEELYAWKNLPLA